MHNRGLFILVLVPAVWTGVDEPDDCQENSYSQGHKEADEYDFRFC